MPELPEVETVCRGLIQTIDQDTITSVNQRRKNLRIDFPVTLSADLMDQKIDMIKRRSKYILIHLSNKIILVIHLGMSGRILITEPEQTYAPQKHDHLILDFVSGRKLVYTDPRRFGMIFTMKESEAQTHKLFCDIGPEPFANNFNAAYLFDKLKARKSNIKTALLDQKLVAGIGNIYASEALYMAGIHPEHLCNTVTAEQCNDLTASIQHVLRIAIEAGGSTLKDYKHADGNMGYFQFNFAVYDREGHPCKNCDCAPKSKEDGVQKIVQSGRSTYFCAKKQS